MPGHDLSLADGALLLDADAGDLCASYFSLGGTLDCPQMWRCIADDACGTYEHNVIAQALNEHFLDIGRDDFPVAYRHDAPPVER